MKELLEEKIMKKVKNYENLVVGGEYFDGSERFLQFQGLANNRLLKFCEIDEEGDPKKDGITFLTKEESESLYINYEPCNISSTNLDFFYELDNLLVGDLICWGDDGVCKVDATATEKRWLTYVNNDYFLWEIDKEQTKYCLEYMENSLEDESLVWVEKWDDLEGWIDCPNFPGNVTIKEFEEWCIGASSDFFPTVNSKNDILRLNYAYIVDGREIFGDED